MRSAAAWRAGCGWGPPPPPGSAPPPPPPRAPCPRPGAPPARRPAGEGRTGARGLAAPLERWPGLGGLGIGPPQGLLVWAPVCALAVVAVWLLVRSRRERLARVLGEQADVEVSAGFLLAVCAAA